MGKVGNVWAQEPGVYRITPTHHLAQSATGSPRCQAKVFQTIAHENISLDIYVFIDFIFSFSVVKTTPKEVYQNHNIAQTGNIKTQ